MEMDKFVPLYVSMRVKAFYAVRLETAALDLYN